MSVVVLGCGRSGTNIALEILRGSSSLEASSEVENKSLCSQRHKVYPSNYLTKCDTCYFKPRDFVYLLFANHEMKVIWTIRDPRDMILSKIKRGQPKSKGGDGSERVSDDATPKGCIDDIMHMYKCYTALMGSWEDRILVVKMEDVLTDTPKEVHRMCDFLDIEYESTMCNFVGRMRNKDKRKRYKTVDQKQVALWKNWDSVYDGFFKNNNYDIKSLFEEVKPLVKEFGYETSD